MKTVVILNYGIGNVRSIYNALKMVDARPLLSDKPEDIQNADAVILPGVGAFAKGMENLQQHKLIEPVHAYIKNGKPFMGICLGMQMLLDESEEFGITQGLGLIQGKVKKLTVKDLRLPHVSWNEIDSPKADGWAKSPLQDIANGENMYFVHSFAACPEKENDVLAVTRYEGFPFCSAVRHQNVYGVQFHPEKSGEKGLKILRRFVSL